MRYMLLIYEPESIWETMPESQRQAIYGEYMQFTEAIRESGHYIAGDPLDLTSTATTVRVRDGRLSATDGPFAETREQLGGYYMIRANHLDEALSIAARIPCARTGCVEVRPVVDMGGLD